MNLAYLRIAEDKRPRNQGVGDESTTTEPGCVHAFMKGKLLVPGVTARTVGDRYRIPKAGAAAAGFSACFDLDEIERG